MVSKENREMFEKILELNKLMSDNHFENSEATRKMIMDLIGANKLLVEVITKTLGTIKTLEQKVEDLENDMQWHTHRYRDGRDNDTYYPSTSSTETAENLEITKRERERNGR